LRHRAAGLGAGREPDIASDLEDENTIGSLGSMAGRGTPIRSDVELRVTHYAELRIADRDNLLKPIQDALQAICYIDDRQVKDTMSNWRDINGKFTIRFVSMPLAAAFSNGEEFLHIRLWVSAEPEDLG